MWRFRSSTDTLVTSDSSASNPNPDPSQSNTGVVAYIKSKEGIMRLILIICSVLTIICACSLPPCSLTRWNFFTSIVILSIVSSLLVLYSLRVPQTITFFQWFGFEYIFGLVLGLCSFANCLAFFVMIHEQKSVGTRAGVEGFAGFFNLVIALILVINGLRNRRLWNTGSTGPDLYHSYLIIGIFHLALSQCFTCYHMNGSKQKTGHYGKRMIERVLYLHQTKAIRRVVPAVI